jgi:hypothetical protein
MVSTKHCWDIKWGVGKDWQSTTMASSLASQWHHANDSRYRLVMRLLGTCRYFRVQETRCRTKIIHTDRLQRLESMMKGELFLSMRLWIVTGVKATHTWIRRQSTQSTLKGS